MYERLEWLIGNDNVNKIKTKTVLIVGLGGVGGYAVTSLIRSGVQKVIIVDHDIVDITNLNRQIIATHSTIGMNKIDAMEQLLLDINPNIKIIKHDVFLTADNIDAIFNEPIDYVIDACDTINTKKAIINKCLIDNIPFISSMGTGNRMDPTMIEIKDIRKTDNDPIARILRRWVKSNKINKKITVACSKEVPKKLGNRAGSNSFVPASCGLAIASYVIKSFIDK